MTIEPAVDGLESDTKLLGELGLAQTVFEPVDVELVNKVLGHNVARI